MTGRYLLLLVLKSKQLVYKLACKAIFQVVRIMCSRAMCLISYL